MINKKIYSEEMKIGTFIAKKGIRTLDNKIQYYIIEISHLLNAFATEETVIIHHWPTSESNSELKCRTFWDNLKYSEMTFTTCVNKKYKEN